MLKFPRKLLSVSLFSLLTIAAAGSASAMSVYHPEQPRRAQVNNRLDHQTMRIENKLHRGEISRHEARRLQYQVHRLRQEERVLAHRNNGHLTARDQYILNRQENRLSHRISRM